MTVNLIYTFDIFFVISIRNWSSCILYAFHYFLFLFDSFWSTTILFFLQIFLLIEFFIFIDLLFEGFDLFRKFGDDIY